MLEREIPRDRHFESDEDEARLLAAADEHLRSLIIAMLDTVCRPGELLSLQWQDVTLVSPICATTASPTLPDS
jgi:integrase